MDTNFVYMEIEKWTFYTLPTGKWRCTARKLAAMRSLSISGSLKAAWFPFKSIEADARQNSLAQRIHPIFKARIKSRHGNRGP